MKIITILKHNAVLIAILLLAAVLRLYNISFQSPWLDEIHTLNEASPSHSFLGVYDQLLIAEPHPPLYFYLIHFCFKIFGYSIETARLFSAVCGILGVYAMYLLAKIISTRTVALMSAIVLSVNSFHILYSQDARMYSFFFLFTALSLYSLVKFINSPTWKNTMVYSIFATLMIYGHFFRLLGLFAQYLIILIVIIGRKGNLDRTLLIRSFVSGIVTLILYIPSFKLFMRSASIKEIWIPKPEPDIYTTIYKALIGNFEVLTILFTILILVCILKYTTLIQHLRASKLKDQFNRVSEGKNKFTLSFIIFLVWTAVILIIPVVKSYVSLPMIVDRYYINMLPIILIMAAMGINVFKANIFKKLLLLTVVLVSILNILFIKKYYTTVSKTQFREASNFIIKNNKDETPVISSLGWYVSYFLQNETVSFHITNKSLEEYVAAMKDNKNRHIPFWYIDGHGRPFNISVEAQKFLTENFIVKQSYNGFDVWTKYFVPKDQVQHKFEISKINILKKANGNNIKANVESFSFINYNVKISGWAYIDSLNSEASSITVYAINNTEAYDLYPVKIIRKDVTKYFDLNFDASNSGFDVNYNASSLPKGIYTIGIYIENPDLGKEGLLITDKTIEVK